tara:strand:+ start:700 stop:1044 length:345 start_codon:yes stop_codon:yes gene_type:complete
VFLPEPIYIAIIVLLLFLLIYVAKKLYTFSIIILNIEESIEESLDLLNHHYGKMNEVVQKPVFFDSIEIRQVVNDIKQCHFAILKIANKLTSDTGMRSEIKEKDSQDKELDTKQ